MLLLHLLLFPLMFACCESNEWNGIVPLKSTRVDVEKILGKPLPHSVAKHAAAYETKEERVSVTYSTGYCREDPNHGWDVPELTVISVMVTPNASPKLSDLKLDGGKFKKSQDPEILNLVYFTNEQDGVTVGADNWSDTVEWFRYTPQSAFNNLLCKKLKDK
jgi:hypothetical protein